MFSLQLQDALLQKLKRIEQRIYKKQYARLSLVLSSLEGENWSAYRAKALASFPSWEEIRSILIFKPDEIGDAVHSMPAIMELKKHFSKARFFLLCQESAAPVYERSGLIDEISTVEVKKFFLRFPRFSVKKGLYNFSIQEFDVAVFLRTYPQYYRHFLTVPSRFRLQPMDPRMRSRKAILAPVSLWGAQRRHQAFQLMEMASFLSGRRSGMDELQYPTFRWTEEDQKALGLVFGNQIPERFAVAHPFARYETRRYPLDYWQVILRWVKEKYDLPVVIIGDKTDGQIYSARSQITHFWQCILERNEEDEKSARKRPSRPPGTFFESDEVEAQKVRQKAQFVTALSIGSDFLEMQGELTLGQSGFLCSRAALFLGNESGPAHWASALGVPAVIFFGGHSLEGEWAPRGKVLILNEPVPCSPCHRRVCPGYGVKCLTGLYPGKVTPRIKDYLNRILESSDRGK